MSEKRFARVTAAVLVIAMAFTTAFLFAPESVGVSAHGMSLAYESKIFNRSEMMTVEITVPQDQWEWLLENATAEEYISCDVSVNGNLCYQIGIRCKGNSSLMNVDEKNRYSFKLKFDEYVSDQKLLGLDKMVLNNTDSDATWMKEYLAYYTMESVGVDVPLYAFAKIYVNGEFWGLYLAAEVLEESYALRNYGTSYGDLYKVETMDMGNMGNRNGDGGNQMMPGNMPENFNPEDMARMFEEMAATGELPAEMQNMMPFMQGTNGDSTTSEDTTNKDITGTSDTAAAQEEVAQEDTAQSQGMQPPEGFSGNMGTPPEGFSGNMGTMPKGFTGTMPEGFTDSIPEGFTGNTGDMPQFPGAVSSDTPTDAASDVTSTSETPAGETQPTGTPPEGASADSPDTQQQRTWDFGNRGQRDGMMGGGGFGGMAGGNGSDLIYIDDDIESYSAIFTKTVFKSTKNKDKQRVVEALGGIADPETPIEDVVDVDQMLRYIAGNAAVGNGDSYFGNMMHNYYVYEKNGKITMLPWDYNLAYGGFTGDADTLINLSIDEPFTSGTLEDRPIMDRLLENDSYKEIYYSYIEAIGKMYTNGEVAALIDELNEMIRPWVDMDPTKEYTIAQYDTAVETLKDYIQLRGQSMLQQLDGDTTRIDTSSISLSSMGSSMGGTRQMINNFAEGNADFAAMGEAMQRGVEQFANRRGLGGDDAGGGGGGGQWPGQTAQAAVEDTGLPDRYIQLIAISAGGILLAIGVALVFRRRRYGS